MKIALIQMSSQKGEISSNIEVTAQLFLKAQESGSDIIVFPEMNITGYFSTPEYLKYALTLDSKEIAKILELTRKTNNTIIFGIAEKKDNKFYITQIVAESGKIIGVYRKKNIINDEAKIFTSDNSESIFNKNKLKYGITICADIDLPELFQKYATSGCNLIIECASPDLYGNRNPRNWESGYKWWRDNCIEKIGKYAKNNNIKIVVATQSGRNIVDDFPGGGFFFSEKGKIIAETRDYKQEILVIEL
jgi:predicted amidohydrolase